LEDGPFVFVPNHHGWFDGYLMFIALTKLEVHFVDWITEFDAFPLFGKVGGMPFPADDPQRRTATIRQTLKLMRGGRSLLLFAESHLHYPPDLLPFSRVLDTISTKVPQAKFIPVAIRYELALHERPEAFLSFGDAVSGSSLAEQAREAVKNLLDSAHQRIPTREGFEPLFHGTKDVNERWDMRRLRNR
jgi:1-acyl-sn-glycerol-3-phosphate acyltransferase